MILILRNNLAGKDYLPLLVVGLPLDTAVLPWMLEEALVARVGLAELWEVIAAPYLGSDCEFTFPSLYTINWSLLFFAGIAVAEAIALAPVLASKS